jgi:signal transduction histidine kinase/HAMP domain-containing protein/ActR/RegA family two-component response regulator
MSGLSSGPVDVVDTRVLLGVLARVKGGDFSARMPFEWTGVAGKIADGFNEVIVANEALGLELARVSRVVGRQGELSQRVVLGGSTQSWAGSVESVNSLIDALVRPTSEMQRVIGAVADGDLSKKVSIEVRGEMLDLKNTINAMVDQLNGFISEVTRVAREVGTEGKLGQAAAVTIEVGGVWKDLTDNVNLMAGNLTGQVRNIAEVTTAVANGDLSKKISADVKGEFLELKNTVNAMVDQLNRFASEVTRVAREVGVEGKLGGQAQSAEVAGVWKDLTDNVNQLAANLTNQVRAISDVATAVTEGDLTRQVGVEASGEVAVLKDKLNEMIRNLRETTRENTEQDWLKTNLERFTRMLQGQRDLATVSRMILSELASLLSAQHGVFYTLVRLEEDDEPVLQYQAGYGYRERKHLANQFRLGEGLVGQCAQEKERILLTDVPGDYVTINSGLGESPPLNIIVLPILFEGSVRAVVELASFSPFSAAHKEFLDQLTESIGLVLNTIEANTLTENLLRQSQSQSQELRSRQEDLRSSNEDLAKQAARLAEQNTEMEAKNREVELAKRLVEEKAEQLAVSSAFKSEFFSNMSHELRTPLNSLLILASELKANPERNLTDAQVQYASIIQSSGSDLLRLLNDVLDLAKVESGTVVLEIGELPLVDLQYALEREFGPLADQKGVTFSVELAAGIPGTIATDSGRLRQVLKNLLANAFKFTERGEVTIRVSRPNNGWRPANHELAQAGGVTAFSISDTGIGIAAELQQRIFEAFAQGDGTTARKYGGTGLGLSISRQLVQLLGGEMTLTSTLGEGSTFTVYLPSASDDDAVTVIPEAAAASLLHRSSDTAPEATPLEPPRAAQAAAVQSPRAPAPEAEAVEPPPPAPHIAAAQSLRAPVSHAPARPPTLTPVPARPPPEPLVGAAVLAGKKVLVVDDDFRNIFAITVLLERGNLNVISAESGGEGISVLERMPDIDIVLVDIMMPIMNGYDTMRAMRELPGLGRLPIIALTAKTGGGERERCIEAGASAYIPKPVENGPDFLVTLGDCLTAARAEASDSEVTR